MDTTAKDRIANLEERLAFATKVREQQAERIETLEYNNDLQKRVLRTAYDDLDRLRRSCQTMREAREKATVQQQRIETVLGLAREAIGTRRWEDLEEQAELRIDGRVVRALDYEDVPF